MAFIVRGVLLDYQPWWLLAMRHRASGLSLIELMVGLAILAFLLFLAMPNFSAWMRNAKIRTAANSVINGLNMARAEAVRRNVPVRFQLTDSLAGGCTLKPNHPDADKPNTNWVISVDDPSNLCGNALIDEGVPLADNVAPRIIQKRSAAEDSGRVIADANMMVMTFNGLGRLTTTPPDVNGIPTANVRLTPPDGVCSNAIGAARCLCVTVSIGGQVRLCDPNLTDSTDPQSCFNGSVVTCALP